MSISVTTDLTTITAAENTTDSGTFYRLNGTSSGNPAADADAFVQGTGCIAHKMGATQQPTDVGGHFNSTLTFDLTNKHLYHWRQIVTAGNMETKANRGVQLGLTNTSTTSTTAWSTTNYKTWFLDGNDTVKSAEGWKCYVLDPSGTADASAGTLTLSTVKNVGFLCRQVSGVTSTVSNQFVDAVRMGTGLTATASSAGDTITLSAIYGVDSTSSNAWGILTQSAGIYYGAGKINVGSSIQTNTCTFNDSNQVLVWRDFPVADTFYEINLIGAALFKTTFQLNSCVVRGQAAQPWTVTCGSNTEIKLYGCALANLRAATLTSTSILSGCSFNACGTIDVAGAAVTACDFTSPTATQLKVDTTAEMAVITDSTFTSSGTGHAIELTATGSYDFDNLTFSGYASSNGSTGNEAVYVNVASGSVTLNITGGSTPSYRTAGATVTVVSGSVTALLTATDTSGSAIQSAVVMVKAAAGGPFPVDVTVTISNSGTTATVTHTAHGLATNDKVLIKGASHYQNNGVFTVTVTDADHYTYTLASAPGSNPTGTIKSTFVVLSGTTNASGQISMSRVFASDQPVTGWVRKSSGAPYYRTAQVSGSVDSATGAALSALLLLDQ